MREWAGGGKVSAPRALHFVLKPQSESVALLAALPEEVARLLAPAAFQATVASKKPLIRRIAGKPQADGGQAQGAKPKAKPRQKKNVPQPTDDEESDAPINDERERSPKTRHQKRRLRARGD